MAATPPTLRRQLRAFARRHRSLVASAIAVFVVLVGATVVSIGFAMRSQRAEDVARAESREAEAARARIEQLLATSLGHDLDQIGVLAPRVGALPGGNAVAAEMLSGIQTQLDAINDAVGRHPRVDVTLAHAYARLADFKGNPNYAHLRDLDGALTLYGRVREILAPLVDHVEFGTRAKRLVVQSMFKSASVRLQRGPSAEAAADLTRARTQAEALADALPQHFGARADLATIRGILAHQAMKQLAFEEAEREATAQAQAIRLLQAHPEARDDEARLQLTLSTALSIVGQARYHQQDLAGAKQALAEARSIRTRLAAAAPQNSRNRAGLANVEMWLGMAAWAAGEHEEGDRLAQRALDTWESLRREDPDDPRLLPNLCMAWMDWVQAGTTRREPDEAPDAVTRAARARAKVAADRLEQLVADTHPSSFCTAFVAKLRKMAAGDKSAFGGH